MTPLGPRETVRVGCTVPVAGDEAKWSSLARRDGVIAIAEAGLDHLVVGDHISFHGGDGADGLILAAAALGCRPDLPVYVGVYLLALRHPVPAARQVADLATLAPGMLTLGVGLGGEDRHEYEVCGVDPRRRGLRTDESLSVLRRLLCGDSVTLEGVAIDITDARIQPAPSTPVPVIIGGRSDAALTRASRFGDGWLGIWVSPDRYAQAVHLVQTQAEAAGRSVPRWSHGLNVWCGLARTKEVAQRAVASGMQRFYGLPYERFARWSPAGAPDDVALALKPYLDSGCHTFNLIPCGAELEATVDLAAQVRNHLVAA